VKARLLEIIEDDALGLPIHNDIKDNCSIREDKLPNGFFLYAYNDKKYANYG